jgi:hypothetical protein
MQNLEFLVGFGYACCFTMLILCAVAFLIEPRKKSKI